MGGRRSRGFWWWCRDAGGRHTSLFGGCLQSFSRNSQFGRLFSLFSVSYADRQTDRQASLFQTWAFVLSKPLRVLQRADGMILPSEIDEIELKLTGTRWGFSEGRGLQRRQ